jgi:hypothetical protein
MSNPYGPIEEISSISGAEHGIVPSDKKDTSSEKAFKRQTQAGAFNTRGSASGAFLDVVTYNVNKNDIGFSWGQRLDESQYNAVQNGYLSDVADNDNYAAETHEYIADNDDELTHEAA